ncbi:hypothetical protein F5Y13DRAFT_29442 [Hypoxylon sp. FL1857]|nr:hypothetical protein F5Y13DRAFT_29442 [Hypoxylon sp. FL1857]
MNPDPTTTERAASIDHHRSSRPSTRRDFEIAIICALTLEADAVSAIFDHHWDDDGPPYDKAQGDPNAYTTGTIGRHNVVLAHMPGMGKASAAAVAANIRASFPNIKLAVVVGVCGCSPWTPNREEIILGDVIVGTGVVQYDLGRQMPERFVRKNTLLDALGRPNPEIRGVLSKLQGLRGRKILQNKMASYLAVLQCEPGLAAQYPGVTHDKLFSPTYRHIADGKSCDECGCNGPLIPRTRLQQDNHQAVVHFGLIASCDKVLKSGQDRETLFREEAVIGFEMEGAGVWDNFPCVVIKGACDYADSHKTKAWQRYAAATAAACMKAFLDSWVPSSSGQPVGTFDRPLTSLYQKLSKIETTLDDIQQNGAYTRLHVDQISTRITPRSIDVMSHIEELRPTEAIPPTALVEDINRGLWTCSRAHSEILNIDGRSRSPLDPVNSTFEIDIQHRTARLTRLMSSPVIHAADDSSESTGDLDRLRCKCKIRRYLKVWNRGPLGFKIETQGAEYCPVHARRSSTSYTMEAKLSPWINRTLELVLMFNGGKNLGIHPGLNFRATVKRSESPIFQLFDRFVDECLLIWKPGNSLDDESNRRAPMIMRSKPHNIISSAVWDEERSTKAMPDLIRGIIEAIRAGKASGDDSDENGNNLLTEISYLACLIQTPLHFAAPQLHYLLQLAQVSKVDPMVVANMHNSRRYIFARIEDSPMTAMSYLCSVMMSHKVDPSTDSSAAPYGHGVSIFRALKSYEGAVESIGEFNTDAMRLQKLKLLLADPELSEGMDYPDLHLAIIRRSLSTLKKLFYHGWSESQGFGHFEPVELAVGWTEGLQFLVDQGCYIGRAFQIACQLGDDKSASILLSSSSDIFSSRYSESEMSSTGLTFNLLESAGMDAKIFRLAAKELWKRRDELRTLLLGRSNLEQLFVEDFFGSLELDESTHCLLAEATDLPDRLKCWDIGSPHCFRTIHGRRPLDVYDVYDVNNHKILYDVGFVDMQALCRHGMTPLAECCARLEKIDQPEGMWGLHPSHAWFIMVTWFVGKGADPDFSCENLDSVRWPHLQFYLALATDYSGHGIKQIFGICDSTLTTDLCRCYCSSKGCIPPFLLWCCSFADRKYHSNCENRMALRKRKLEDWMKLCGFRRHDREKSYTELCRRELFDRLGMAHTCCAASEVQSTQEKNELSSEDASTKKELLWLVRIYKVTRKLLSDVTIRQFWRLWWGAADDIVLPLLPEEACRDPWWVLREEWPDGSDYSDGSDDLDGSEAESELRIRYEEIEQKREHQWLALLRDAGYEGWEYDQVIKFHFTRFWLLAKAHRQRLVSWKRHRLMAKPRFIMTKRGKNIPYI